MTVLENDLQEHGAPEAFSQKLPSFYYHCPTQASVEC
jgi:hypothetical protein